MDNLEEPNIEPKNKLHRNFITMAEDGLLIVWDLKKVLNWEDKTHFFHQTEQQMGTCIRYFFFKEKSKH